VNAVEMELGDYPKNLRMSHGNDNEREWWEWKRKDKAVAIQCLPCRKHPWKVYFVRGSDIFPLDGDTTCSEDGLKSCVDSLKALGFKVTLS
jgi:hypothetical protein